MRDFLKTIKGSNVVKSVNGRRESSMETEDLVLNQSCKWQVVKEVSEVLPNIGIAVLAKALIIESIDLGDLTRLMVTTEDGDSVFIADLEGDKKSHSLNTVVSTVNIVTHEKVVCVGAVSTNAEKLHQVMELTMNITTNSHRTAHRLYIALFNQNLASLLSWQ